MSVAQAAASTIARPAPVSASGPLAKAVRFVAGLCIAAIFWEALVLGFGIKPFYLPRLSTILQAIAATPLAYAAGFVRTATETLLGFVTGGLFGIAIGIVFFRLRLVRDLVFPVFIVSQTIPVIAFGALVVLWLGNTLFAKAVIAFYLTFFPVTVNTLLGLNSVDARQVALMRSFGASPMSLLRRLQLPAALPYIFVALRLASSLSLVGAIVGEWFGDTTGIGVLLLQAMYNENVVATWAALLTAALLGSSFYAVVAFAERKIVFWGVEQ